MADVTTLDDLVRRMAAATRGTTSARRSTRPALVAKRSSAPSSGSPAAVQNCRHWPSLPTASTSQVSAVANSW